MIDRRFAAGAPTGGDEHATAVLKRHGRSFYFASHFLPSAPRRRATRLYAFCRWVDDLVDENRQADDNRPADTLESVASDLASRKTSLPQLADFMSLMRETGIPAVVPGHLLQGLRSDQGQVAIVDEDALRRYAYQVAGSVGVMMAAVLGLDDRRGFARAIDLGIAMQMTNIARDVAEDARRQRRYLPANWFEPAVLPDLTVELGRHEHALRQATRRLLAMAEPYYASGERGLALLSSGVQPGLRVAARVYREIGVMIGRQRYSPLAPRARVPTWRKLMVALRALAVPPIRPNVAGSFRIEAHDSALHSGFEDLVAEAMDAIP